ncbi:DUF1223 domain-containing protein [Rhizobium tubonense]|uniref:DUF1223 domain-containing protein n=1 Tax=Rhizobium tubonense TaxID=484088 RepID=A0A2W4CPE3_9HYPH|nr:DUF1223 domain-containing protein [Rhizobium tubonense]PZM14637.1 hypothetical protein CPY51_10390 [Rhizobium tubonense]
MKSSIAFGLSVIAILFGFESTQAAAGQSPTVVELFTSQGCSSCPPANANLVKLSNDPGILALSFSVTYWDYLGWKDSFGKPEFSNRQANYEPALGQSGPFTPQMVINGHYSTVGFDLKELRAQIASEKKLSGPTIMLSKDVATIDAGNHSGTPADVWFVRYDPGTVEVPVSRGENAGATLPHAHVVRLLAHLGTWSGKALSLTLPSVKDGPKTAIIIQVQNGGQILAAATE